MPQVASSHLMEARAIARVQTILSESDALSEVVKNDYGEDLIVQSHWKGEADPFQILVQVKGSGRIAFRDGGFKMRFAYQHLYRWISQSASILVCVYDDETKRVYAFSPKALFSLWDILTAKTQTISVTLTTEDEFTVDSAKRKIWECRIEHFSSLLAMSETRQRYASMYDTPKKVRAAYQRETGLICLLFLKTIGMVTEDAFSESCRKIIRNGPLYFVEMWPDEHWNLRHLMMFALLGEVSDAAACGVPSNIMEQVTEAAGHFYKRFHPLEWKEAEAQMQVIWTPYKGMKKPS